MEEDDDVEKAIEQCSLDPNHGSRYGIIVAEVQAEIEQKHVIVRNVNRLLCSRMIIRPAAAVP